MRTHPMHDVYLLEGSEPQGSAYPDCESCQVSRLCAAGMLTEDFVSLARVVRRAKATKR